MTDLAAAAARLRSPDAAGLLMAGLTGDPATVLPDFEAALTTWQYRPGAEVVAGYEVNYRGESGEPVSDYLYATTATVPTPAIVEGGGHSFRLWRHPHDPALPGLPLACHPDEVMSWLQVSPATFSLELLSYRPLRRAVLRAIADDATFYLKVVRPDRFEQLALRQDLIAGARLGPRISHRPYPGVLITPQVKGRSLATILATPGQPGLPTAEALIEALDRLPERLTRLPRRPAWADRLDFHAATAIDRLPEHAGRVGLLRERLQGVLDAAPEPPVVPTHGDFHEANIFLDDSPSPITLIDVDASGPGRREDDLACLLAHLAVLPGLSPAHYAQVPTVLDAWTQAFAAQVEPASLFARVSAVILSLVAGGDDTQAVHRLELAEQWVRL